MKTRKRLCCLTCTKGGSLSTTIAETHAGRLARVSFSGGPVGGPLDLIYQWNPASQLTSRTWNGHTQLYTYDPSGQLLKVSALESHEDTNATKEANSKSNIQNSKLLEAYAYDKAGNMLEKIIAGEKTTMTYDAANQLSTSTVASASLPMRPVSPATFSYDRAGRLLSSPGGPTRTYGWLDKVTKLTTPSGKSLRLTYWPDGQLATKKRSNPQISQKNAEQGIQQASNKSADSVKSADERFLWDGLALLRRNDTIYIIEPHPSGGVPITSHPVNKPDELTYYLNDLLGTTLATVDGPATHFASLTAFGQSLKLAAEIPKPSDLGGTTTPNLVPQTPTLPRDRRKQKPETSKT